MLASILRRLARAAPVMLAVLRTGYIKSARVCG